VGAGRGVGAGKGSGRNLGGPDVQHYLSVEGSGDGEERHYVNPMNVHVREEGEIWYSILSQKIHTPAHTHARQHARTHTGPEQKALRFCARND